MRLRGPAVGLLSVVVLATSLPAQAAKDQLSFGSEVRVQTPNSSVTTCPLEGEPAVTVTSAGSWVGYNDDQSCPLSPVAKLHLTSVQLVPAAGGPPRYVDFPDGKSGEFLSGDPALTPDPTHPGSVLLATLYQYAAGLGLAVYRIDPDLSVTTLPSPTIKPASPSDDKEFIASDTSASSPYRGRAYLVWDDFARGGVVLRALYGGSWHDPVTISDVTGTPDVATAPNGDVAVTYIAAGGVTGEVDIAVRVSRDGGKTFGAPVIVARGSEPGRQDPSCPLRGTVGERQRANPSPRITYDAKGVLHVVAALGPLTTFGVTAPGAGTGGASSVVETSSLDRGRTFAPARSVDSAETPGSPVEWAPAIARLPHGGVAVEWLQVSDLPQTQYDSWMAVQVPGSSRFARPVRVSTATSSFPPATEALGNANCYGIGDYTSLAPTAKGVVAVWPTGDAKVATPYFDTDVMLRAAALS